MLQLRNRGLVTGLPRITGAERFKPASGGYAKGDFASY